MSKPYLVGVHAADHGFAPRWLARLKELGVGVRILDFNVDDIVKQAKDCDAVMWHWSHSDPKAVLFARQLLESLEAAGKKVFPSRASGSHFDDKVAQKYLLEAIDAPLVPSHVFYDSTTARMWLDQAAFPVVFKLRGGAGSQNVRLVRKAREAERLVAKAFGRGFPAFDGAELFRERWLRFQRSPSAGTFWLVLRGLARWLIPSKVSKVKGRDRGYCYFQEFMPGNSHDTRIVVIGNRAISILRQNREGDFRASGSGMLNYDPGAVDMDCVRTAFDVCRKLGAECLAFDFVLDPSRKSRIVEISYAFTVEAYYACGGWWDSTLQWHQGEVDPAGWMVDDLVMNMAHQMLDR